MLSHRMTIIDAAADGDLAFLKRCYHGEDKPKNPPQNETWRQALLHSAAKGHIHIVQWLMSKDHHEPLASPGRLPNTALLEASGGGHLHIVQWLLSEGRSLSSERDFNGLSISDRAAEQGHLHVLQWFVETAICCSSDASDAVFTACTYGHLHIVKWMIKSGVVIPHLNAAERTAAQCAALGGHLEVVQFLLTECFGIPHNESPDGNTILLCAASTGDVHIMQWMLDKGGASVCERNTKGQTALLHAAAHGHIAAVKWLLEKGYGKAGEADNRGLTALLYAAVYGRLGMVQWLLCNNTASISEQDCDGHDVVILACMHGHIFILQWLVVEGYSTASRELWECLGWTTNVRLMYENVTCGKDSHWLHPTMDKTPSLLLRTLLLAPGPHPPAAVRPSRTHDFRMYDFTGPIRESAFLARTLQRAEALRASLPLWKIEMQEIAAFFMKNIPEPIIALILRYSSPSVEEIWSAELCLIEPSQTNTRKRHAP